MAQQPTVAWLRRDLRLRDNPVLFHAAAEGRPVLVVFIYDPQLIDRLPSDGAAFDFQAQCLTDLSQSLSERGVKLVILQGPAVDVHRRLIEKLKPASLHFGSDYVPGALLRDAAVTALYQQAGAKVHAHKEHVVHGGEEVLTSGRPYTVFTPYSRAWHKQPHPKPLGEPEAFQSLQSVPGLEAVGVLGARELGRTKLIPHPAFQGGERAALQRWHEFLKKGLASYATDRDVPAIDGTSRMSPYLRFGCISVVRLLHDCQHWQQSAEAAGRDSAAKYIDELVWREFYQAVLYHFPRLLKDNFRAMFNAMPWSSDSALLEAWQQGVTGYPMVDAGMRQLNTIGWMHNRVRMVTASFLTKHLMHHWRAGEAWFGQKLIDGELGSNNGGWQWAAGTGVDQRPLRIFNPTLQAERYDPQGDYIRQWVPELSRVPGKHIHWPHGMTLAQQHEAGCVLGRDYPHPIVEHAQAVSRYKAEYAKLREG